MIGPWRGQPEPPPPPPPGLAGWGRIVVRGLPIGLLLGLGFPLLLLLRGPERLLSVARRPVTPWITQGVCIAICAIVGLRREVSGRPMAAPGAFVCNHVSWLDILVLNAGKRLCFVAKSEVAGWPGIGLLARGTGTVFIRRARAQAATHARMLDARLSTGDKLLFFPEGTSTDGRRVLPFKTTLFAAFLSEALRPSLKVQPVTLVYRPPEGASEAFYGWWGEMPLAPNLVAMLAAPRHGTVEIVYHAPLAVADHPDRKALARAAETAVRAGLETRLPQPPQGVSPGAP